MDRKLLTAIVRWDVLNWSQAIRFWDRNVDFSSVERSLELGGREGGLSLWIAHKGKPVVCSDLIDTAATAEPQHRKHALTGPVTYEDIDATAIPYENHFDVIAFKSMLGGIGRAGGKAAQQTTIDQIHKALRPDGKLLFAENLTASPLHQAVRRRFVRWGQTWRYVTLAEMREFLHAFSHVELRTTGVLGAFGRNEPQRRLLSYADVGLLNFVTPPSWRYIAYGIAQK